MSDIRVYSTFVHVLRAIFFDLYGTLVRFHPPTEEIQSGICHQFGLSAATEGVRKGYVAADDYMARENEKAPIFARTPEAKKAFFARYEQLVLKGAGLDVPLPLAASVWERVSQVPKELVLYEDVLPTIRPLKEMGLTLGILSNLNRDIGEMVNRLGLNGYVDFWVTSQEVGANKPHPPIFLAALERAKVAASEAIHVGDQYHSDVRGAQAVGISPVLLDRGGAQAPPAECPTINTLAQLVSMVEAMLPQGAR